MPLFLEGGSPSNRPPRPLNPPGVPAPDERIKCAIEAPTFFAKRPIERRIRENIAVTFIERSVEEPLQTRRIRGAASPDNLISLPPLRSRIQSRRRRPERRQRIVPTIETIVPEEPFQQKLNFNLLKRLAVHRLSASCGAHLSLSYSHTLQERRGG